ncbi:MAG TPA: histidine ammonia-lyase [Gemmatimonadaceae bacterium]|nr:histidine ammonia-lyase [Gemmatimonadaceae bacterium]
MKSTVTLDGETLSVADVIAVARRGAAVALSAGARTRMAATRGVVEQIVERGAPVYGVNTGFGKLSEITIPNDQLAALQRNLIRSHAAGVGDPLPDEVVRAMTLLRANVLAKGHSGARPIIADALIGFLTHGIVPVVPEHGSVGASGDLAPLAHLARALLGEGSVRVDGATVDAAAALAKASLEPVVLEAKEGIALINGTQAHTAIAALAAHDTRVLWETANVAGAMSLEALMGTPDAFDARIHAVRGQTGQAVAGERLRMLLANSEIRESHRANDPRVQDAYALRCMPQVHGPAWDALEFATGVITRELNAATDNPLVFADGSMLSGGNFHGQAVGMACDVLAIAVANLAVMAERRIDRLVNPDLNQGLTAFLAAQPGLESGLMMVQVTAAALASECKLLAHPATVDSIPTDGSREDVVPMAMGAARKLRRSVQHLTSVLAIELVCGAAGLDQRAPLRPSREVVKAHAAVRNLVAAQVHDRAPSDDIARIAAAITAGTFVPAGVMS